MREGDSFIFVSIGATTIACYIVEVGYGVGLQIAVLCINIDNTPSICHVRL